MQINKRQLKKWIAELDSNTVGPCNRRFYGRSFFDFSWPFDTTWLRQMNQEFAYKTGYGITYLFHVQDFTFREIATLLELVYIHKILD